MDDETLLSASELRELIWRSLLAAERTPEMMADIRELAARLSATERAVIGRFLTSVRRVADAQAELEPRHELGGPY